MPAIVVKEEGGGGDREWPVAVGGDRTRGVGGNQGDRLEPVVGCSGREWLNGSWPFAKRRGPHWSSLVIMRYLFIPPTNLYMSQIFKHRYKIQ